MKKVGSFLEMVEILNRETAKLHRIRSMLKYKIETNPNDNKLKKLLKDIEKLTKKPLTNIYQKEKNMEQIRALLKKHNISF